MIPGGSTPMNDVLVFPEGWTGLWLDSQGKALFLERLTADRLMVTVAPGLEAQAYPTDQPGHERTAGLPARYQTDAHAQPFVRVEAGVEYIGPTYDLYFWLAEGDQVRIAANDDPIAEIHITPRVGQGLMDDWEHDAGLPWAFPLMRFRKAGPDQTARYQDARNR